LLDALFNTFLVGFLPHACFSDVVELEHATNLYAVKPVKAAY
jgi:hypothetical protein